MTTSRSTLCEVGDMKKTAEALFEENIKLAYGLLWKYYPTFAEDEDMQQEALLGLWRACTTYDSDKSKFSTYAGSCILNQIRGVLRKTVKQPEMVSLSSPVGEDGATLEDLLEDPCLTIDEGLIDLKDYIAGLTELEHKILRMRLQGLTQRQISLELSMSQPWCNRILVNLRKNYLKQENRE